MVVVDRCISRSLIHRYSRPAPTKPARPRIRSAAGSKSTKASEGRRARLHGLKRPAIFHQVLPSLLARRPR